MKRMLLLVLVASALFGGCQSLRELGLGVERPTAHVESVALSRLSFEDAELTAEIAVDNPNAVAIRLTGFSYRLDIEGDEFLVGDQPKGMAIAAFDESTVEFPVELRYENLFATYDSIRRKDEAEYALEVVLRFDLPVLGQISIPLRREGTFPVVRRPSVRVAELALDSITIAGARLSLTVAVENPNGFALGLESLDYTFAVQGREWMDGSTARPQRIPAHGSGEVTTSFSLSFAAFGRTVRDLLLGDDAIEYAFSAEATVDPELELVRVVRLPFTREGRIDLRRR